MAGTVVTLTMPANPGLLRVARLAAAGLASRIGFSFDEIEDVKIAVDELCFALIGGKGRDGNLTVTYRLEADALAIDGEGTFAGATDPTPGALSQQILDAVVDDHGVARDGDTLRFRLLKRRSGEP